MTTLTDSVSFWPQRGVVSINKILYCLWIGHTGHDHRGRWPWLKPPINEILEKLWLSRTCYYSADVKEERTFISLLTGNIVVNGVISENEYGFLRLRLNKDNGFEFATNRLRARIISKGLIIRHLGIECRAGQEFQEIEETDPDWASGRVLRYIIQSIPQENYKNSKQIQENEEVKSLATEEKQTLYALEQYIESEFALEQQAARETPAFVYYHIRPEPRAIVYRQFFRVTLTNEDFKRIQELKPSILEIEVPSSDPIKAEVVDLSPPDAKSEIIISVEKQVAVEVIPNTGKLYLAALDIQQRIRKEVLNNLEKRISSNFWLLPLASDCYLYPSVTQENVKLPASEYPPNPSQIEAIELGAGTPDYLCVLGPPGTGKTTVILNWVNHFVNQGKRVLISSQNNKAVDNVLERLAANNNLTCVRLGNETKISNSIQPLLLDNCATAIQKKLAETLENNLIILSGNIEYLLKLPKLLEEYNVFYQQRNNVHLAIHNLNGKTIELQENLNIVLQQIAIAKNYQDALSIKKSKYKQLAVRFNSENRPILKFISYGLAKIFSWLENALTQKEVVATNQIEVIKSQEERICLEIQQITIQTQQLQKQLQDIELNLQNTKLLKELPPTPLVVEWPLNFFSLNHPFQIEVELNKVKRAIYYYQLLQQTLTEWKTIIGAQRQRSLYPLVLSLVDVVGATCVGINTKPEFTDIRFDVVIIDESGQIQLHNLIVPLSRGPKAILVGDHKQLPPVIDQKLQNEVSERGVETELLKLSWFEILWNKSPENRKVMLNTQFRCPSVISNFISETFYEAKYYAGKGMEKKLPLFSFFTSSLVFIDTSNFPEARRFEKKRQLPDREEVTGNTLETEIVVEILSKALSEKPELGQNNEIGIIAPLANHVRELQYSLRNKIEQGRIYNGA